MAAIEQLFHLAEWGIAIGLAAVLVFGTGSFLVGVLVTMLGRTG
jgi:hypothetical protein